MKPVHKFPNVYTEQKGRWTNYYVGSPSGQYYFDERVIKMQNGNFREVNPERSKLFAAIAKGVSQIGMKEDSTILYLGASHGYTVSFLADMIHKGQIYALDFAPRVMRDMVFIAEKNKNIAPVYASASQIDTYKDLVPEVDVVFMDIAQRNQVEIFLANCKQFLKKGGFGLLALKARSIDVSKRPRDLFKEVKLELERHHNVVDYRELAPLEEDHAFYVIKKR
jgi:fibrillarin-like pre-rRNA processing protein